MSDVACSNLRDLARINRLGGKLALADALDDAIAKLDAAEALIRDFPFLVFEAPGSRSVVGARETSEYAHRLGDWSNRRNAFLKGAK